MKKLLTSLTILALISPISVSNVNGQENEITTANTEASVKINASDEKFNISAAKNLEFEAFDLELGKIDYDLRPREGMGSTELTVTDTRFGVEGYDVKAKLLPGTNNSFPTGTILNLEAGVVTPTIATVNDKERAPLPEEGEIILELEGEERNVLNANRNKTPLQGAGGWIVEYKANSLTIRNKQDTLKPETELNGTIQWTLKNASD